MSDIAEKLRQAYHNDLTDVPILLDGADEIDRLRERVVKLERSQLETSIENNRLREDRRILWDALVHIGNDERIPNWIREIANATLDKEAGQ